MGVSRGLHGAAGHAAHAAGPPARERAPHHADRTGRATPVHCHTHCLNHTQPKESNEPTTEEIEQT